MKLVAPEFRIRVVLSKPSRLWVSHHDEFAGFQHRILVRLRKREITRGIDFETEDSERQRRS